MTTTEHAGVRGFAALALCAACAGKGPLATPATPDALVDAAEREAMAPHATAAALARAGWLLYAVRGDEAAAETRFAAALTADPNQASALFGAAELANDRLDDAKAAALDARLVETHPEDPLAEIALRRLDMWQGGSPATDGALAPALQKVLASGRASVRSAVVARTVQARLAAARGDDRAERARWAEAGALQRWLVAGPFATHRLSELDTVAAANEASSGAAPLAAYETPFGPQAPRRIDVTDGDAGLDDDPGDADVYVATSDVDLAKGGDYLVLLEGAAAARVFVDGHAAYSRVPLPRALPRVGSAPVSLTKGPHRVAVRWSRLEGARFRLTLARRDGAPADFTTSWPLAKAPAAPAPGTWTDDGGALARARSALDAAPGEPDALIPAAIAVLDDDRALARKLVEAAVALSPHGVPGLVLRAELDLRDGDLPDRVARGRAARDEDAALAHRPLPRVLAMRAMLERDAERYDEAQARLDAAGPSPRAQLARARLAQARGNAAEAKRLAAAAESADPGRCDAMQLLFDLARSEDDLSRADELVRRLAGACGSRSALLGHLRSRGDAKGAVQLARALVAAQPSAVAPRTTLADALTAAGDSKGAADVLREALALAPRAAFLHRQLADALEHSGDAPGAKAERERVVALDGGNLRLAHALLHDAGAEPLAWAKRDARAQLAAYDASGKKLEQGAPAVILLDLGALEVHADGSSIERVHTVTKILDRRGLAKYGEVQVPDGAELVELRTLKPDGSVLEPDEVAGKETVSLTGLEPGDVIDFEYVRAMGPRSANLPGFTASSFTFREPEIPLFETTYEVRAPPEAKLEVDAHHFESAPPVEHAAGYDRWAYTARNVPSVVPEPASVSESEYLPWVQAGSGARQDALAVAFAELALMRSRPTYEIDELARTAGGSTPREKLNAIVAKVADAVRGRASSMSFGASASQVLASGRGNRLPVLKAALASAGVASHVVFVRGFGTDPSEHRFPRGDLWSAAVLRVDLPEGPVWLDTSLRLGPVGALPAWLSAAEATVLPEPGESVTTTRTPPLSSGDGRTVAYDLALSKDGALSGSAMETYRGFDSAGAAEALESMDPDRRRQAIESSLARTFRGAVLDELSADEANTPGMDTVLRYRFHASGFARVGPRGALTFPTSFSPAHLGRRFVERAVRQTPLLLDSSDRVRVTVRLALAPGMAARPRPPASAQLAFATFSSRAATEPGRVTLDEELSMNPARVPPEAWPKFKAFAAAVDEAQGAELTVAPDAGVVNASAPAAR